MWDCELLWLTESDEGVVEHVRGQGELNGDLGGGVLACLEEGEHRVPDCPLGHDRVDERSGVEILHAQDERGRVGPAVELRQVGGLVSQSEGQ